MFKTHNFAVALDHNIAWMSQMSKLHFPFKFYHVAIQNMRWKLLFNLMSSLTFTVFSIIFGSHDICSQSLPWDRNMNDLQFRNPKLVRSYPVFHEDALNLYHIHHLTRWPCVVYIKHISYFGGSFFIVVSNTKTQAVDGTFLIHMATEKSSLTTQLYNNKIKTIVLLQGLHAKNFT